MLLVINLFIVSLFFPWLRCFPKRIRHLAVFGRASAPTIFRACSRLFAAWNLEPRKFFLGLLAELVEVFHERHHGAIEPLDLRIRGLNDVIFVRRVSAAAVAETEMA